MALVLKDVKECCHLERAAVGRLAKQNSMWEGPERRHDKKFSSMGCLGVEGVTDDVSGL